MFPSPPTRYPPTRERSSRASDDLPFHTSEEFSLIHRQTSKVSSRSTVVYVYCAASDPLLALTNFDVQTTIAHGTDPSLDIRLGPSQLQTKRRPRFDRPRTNLENRSTSSNKANAARLSRLGRTITTASCLETSHENHIFRSRQTLWKVFRQSLTSSFWPLGRCTKETSSISGRLRYFLPGPRLRYLQLVSTVHSTCKARWPCRCSTLTSPLKLQTTSEVIGTWYYQPKSAITLPIPVLPYRYLPAQIWPSRAP